MWRKRSSGGEREIPAWRRAMQAADDDDGGDADSAPLPPPQPVAASSSTCAAAPSAAPHEPTSHSAAESSSRQSAPSAADSDEAAGDDDDDDENFDPRNYDLGLNEEEPPSPQPLAEEQPLSITPACRVAVANLAFEATRDALEAFVSKCGRVVSIEMPATQLNKRTGFVTFASEESAQDALKLTGGHLSSDRSSVPRPLTVLIAPLGATVENDGLKYDLLRNSVTLRAGSHQPLSAAHSPATSMMGSAPTGAASSAYYTAPGAVAIASSDVAAPHAKRARLGGAS